jgi:hypothetical protein
MIILALDALNYHSVTRYNCKALKQIECGSVDVSDFTLLRTVILWASFLSGKNMEAEIPVDTETQWKFQLAPETTFLPCFTTYIAIDMPAFSLKQRNHIKERRFLRNYFNDEVTIEEFDALIWKNHDENKKEFFKALSHYDLVMGYFDLADAIGHLSFGVSKKMKDVYGELNQLAKEVQSSLDERILIASDHGMTPRGRYGEHCRHGFYSINTKLRLGFPKITSFHEHLSKIAKKQK